MSETRHEQKAEKKTALLTGITGQVLLLLHVQPP